MSNRGTGRGQLTKRPSSKTDAPASSTRGRPIRQLKEERDTDSSSEVTRIERRSRASAQAEGDTDSSSQVAPTERRSRTAATRPRPRMVEIVPGSQDKEEQTIETLAQEAYTDENTKWKRRVKAVVDEMILSKIYPDNDKLSVKLRELGTSETAMNFWYMCFMSTIANDVNYDVLETQGDAVIEARMRNYIALRLGELATADRITKLSMKYVANATWLQIMQIIDPENKFMEIMNTGEFFTINDLPDAVRADIFEAIFGALYYIYNSLMPFSAGVVCDKWFEYVMSEYKIDIDPDYKDPITKLDQMFSELSTTGNPMTKLAYSESTDPYNSTMKKARFSFTKEGINKLQKIIRTLDDYNFNVPREDRIRVPDLDGLVAEKSLIPESYVSPYVRDASKPVRWAYDTHKRVKHTAAELALQVLSSHGITPDWVREAKKIIAAKSVKLISDVLAKMRELGYEDYTCTPDRKFGFGESSFFLIKGIHRDENGNRLRDKLVGTIKITPTGEEKNAGMEVLKDRALREWLDRVGPPKKA